MTHTWSNIPLSLYIHVPWCERKCPYCDFNSHQAKSIIDEDAYITELLNDLNKDIRDFGSAISERQISSIFIGGGTPSLFSSQSYKRLFIELNEMIDLSKTAEVTLEANPGSSEVEKFEGFRQAGINRLSIGVQSFNQSHLQKLGRVHNAQEATNAAEFARKAGFDNFNLDLMFGLPKQNIEQAQQDLSKAISLQPTHLSCYQLTIEPNTLFHHQPPVTPNDDELWDMQEALQTIIANAGYQQYEVSAYGKPNHQCLHNLNYWNFGDYLGIGAGAHGKITTDEGIKRRWKIKHPSTYLSKENKVGETSHIHGANLTFEFMLNALRLNDGFKFDDFEMRTGQSRETIKALVEKHSSLKMLEVNEAGLKPTEFGHNMLNNMLEDYLAVVAT